MATQGWGVLPIWPRTTAAMMGPWRNGYRGVLEIVIAVSGSAAHRDGFINKSCFGLVVRDPKQTNLEPFCTDLEDPAS